MGIQWLWWIIGAAIIVLIGFAISLILQLKKTLSGVDDFIENTQESLAPLLKEVKESVERLNRITEDIEDSTKNVKHLAKAIGDAGMLLDDLNGLVKRTGLSFSVKTASIGVGIKTALVTLARGIIKRGGSTDE